MAYLGNVPARSFISFERQVFTIVNSQTAYTLSHSVTNENDIRLVVNNVVQEPGSGKAYTASGTTLTLSAALTNGTDEMYCVFLGRATATNAPGAGSVSTAQIVDGAVTSAKLASQDITFSEDIILGDSKNAIFGAGSDLKIFHNGSNSFVKDVGSGALILDSNGTDVRITKSDAEFMAKFVTDGAVELYYDNSKKIETTSTGIAVTGGVALGGTGTANTLSDYEEGTWTPSISAVNGFTNTNVDSAYATYTKVGNLVNIKAHIQFPNSSGTVATADYAYIQGLPFAPAVQDNTIMCGYRYNNSSNAIGFTTTATTTDTVRWVCNYVIGSPTRSGGRLSINFFYHTA